MTTAYPNVSGRTHEELINRRIVNTRIHITRGEYTWPSRNRCDSSGGNRSNFFPPPEKERSLLHSRATHKLFSTYVLSAKRNTVAWQLLGTLFVFLETGRRRNSGDLMVQDSVTCIAVTFHLRNFFFTVIYTPSSPNSRNMSHLETKVSYRCGGVDGSLYLLYSYPWEYYYHLEIFIGRIYSISIIKICSLASGLNMTCFSFIYI